MSPFASLLESLSPFEPGSLVGSVPGVNVNTSEVINPSGIPSASVSSCIPLSSLSTSSSPPLPVDENGSDAGALNSIK